MLRTNPQHLDPDCLGAADVLFREQPDEEEEDDEEDDGGEKDDDGDDGYSE